MNEDIIRMALEAGMNVHFASRHKTYLASFEAIVRSEEREACAKLCDVIIVGDECATALINSYADDIRARGQA